MFIHLSTMTKALFLIIFSLTPSILSAQLVNIESKRMQTDSIRFTLNADFSFNHTNNDGEQVNQIDAALSTQLKSKDLKKIYFFLGNYKVIDSEEGNLQNAWFLHGRFNYKLNDILKLESFLQVSCPEIRLQVKIDFYAAFWCTELGV